MNIQEDKLIQPGNPLYNDEAQYKNIPNNDYIIIHQLDSIEDAIKGRTPGKEMEENHGKKSANSLKFNEDEEDNDEHDEDEEEVKVIPKTTKTETQPAKQKGK